MSRIPHCLDNRFVDGRETVRCFKVKDMRLKEGSSDALRSECHFVQHYRSKDYNYVQKLQGTALSQYVRYPEW
jgi:hypothetical protein